MSNDWSNGLCSCFEDCTTCIMAFIVPCYVLGKNAEQVGDDCILTGLSCLVPLLNIWCLTSVRGKIREQKGIDGTCTSDVLTVLFCAFCSLTQEWRELKPPGAQNMLRE